MTTALPQGPGSHSNDAIKFTIENLLNFVSVKCLYFFRLGLGLSLIDIDELANWGEL